MKRDLGSRTRKVYNHLKQGIRWGMQRGVHLDKLEIIDYVFQKLGEGSHSFADLGGVWGVDAAYSFYTLCAHEISHAYLVDTNFTEKVKSKSRRNPNLQLVHGNFGERAVLEQLGKVDAVFLFDVLLHQVKPDWDEILEMYSSVTEYFIIYNQQFTKTQNTVRLLDLGTEEYLANVPRNKEQYKNLFEKMYEVNPEHGRIWRDVHNFWQWGITDKDLFAKMKELNYTLQYYKNCGQFLELKNFENHAFVFQKA